MEEVFMGTPSRPKKYLNRTEENDNQENLENGKEKSRKDKERRVSKFTSREVKQKRDSSRKSKDFKDKNDSVKDTEVLKTKNQDVEIKSENEWDSFKETPREKKKNATQSEGQKMEGWVGTKTFKEEPEDGDFLAILKDLKPKKSRIGELPEEASPSKNRDQVLKDREKSTPGRFKMNKTDEENKENKKEKVNENKEKKSHKSEKEKAKEKRKSQIKSGEKTPKDLAGFKNLKDESDDEVFLTIGKEAQEKRPGFNKADAVHGSTTLKEERQEEDFVTAKKNVKRKRSKTEDIEGTPSQNKKKKMKTENKENEIQAIKKEDEMQHKKIKKEKEEFELKPKKEKSEGNQEPKKKKTKEERDAAAELKAKKKEEEEKQQWRWFFPETGVLPSAVTVYHGSSWWLIAHTSATPGSQRWEEEKYEDGIKWMFLEHKGPVFAPPYEPLPDNVKFYYDGKQLKLSVAAEEVTSFFAKMLDHEYTTNDVFRQNFFMDWRKEMTLEERMIITDLDKCDFTEMFSFYKGKMEEKKNITKEEKLVNKEANEKLIQEFGFCVMDHHRERIGNFKIEPPGLFRGRGDHPKQGMLKKRILPEDVVINCSKDSNIPAPPEGHKWKEVRHDNTVTWLASWTENVQGSIKYVMLNANSRLKGEKDWEKYEVARKLKTCVQRIRAQYREDLKSKEMKLRQRAVALYFIDKLALRAGNEKEEGETADTVGCCSLRVEHIKLYPELDGEKHVVEFDFLGKDSIRYYNKVPVEKQVFKNLQLFLEEKQEGDDLFDRLNTPMLNKHLQSLMDGLTAKVFRTYNASITLQAQLKELTNPDEPIPSKILSYNRANRAVAILCNHQRAPPKTFDQSMANLQTKIEAKKEQISLAKKEVKQAKADVKASGSDKLQKVLASKRKAVQRAEEQLMKLEVQATDREENKQIALGTSKLNYLDPRISVTWCQKWGVGLEKIYNKTQRDKFAWAINMSDVNYEF